MDASLEGYGWGVRNTLDLESRRLNRRVDERHDLRAFQSRETVGPPINIDELDLVVIDVQGLDDGADLPPDEALLRKIFQQGYGLERFHGLKYIARHEIGRQVVAYDPCGSHCNLAERTCHREVDRITCAVPIDLARNWFLTDCRFTKRMEKRHRVRGGDPKRSGEDPSFVLTLRMI